MARAAFAIRTTGAVALVWLVVAISGRPGEGTLRVEIRAGGEVTPAMVCVTSLADGKWRTPPDGTKAPPYSTTREFYEPPPWRPGQIGPVRLTSGDYGDNDMRSFVYGGKSAYPFWTEPAAYFVSEPFSITLPAGRWRLAVAKGVEYLPVFIEFEIKAGEDARRRIDLERWVDMPVRGWYSGDDHVHFPRTKPEHNEFLMTWARAEDVHVTNVLRMGDRRDTFFEQEGYGPSHRFRRGQYVLASGQEDPRGGINDQGHAIALNITAPVRDTSRYHLYDLIFDRVHQQGGLTGYAHFSWARSYYRREDPRAQPTWDSTLNVVRGKVDFAEILQFRRWGLKDYYDFLNLGLKLTASAGSDLPWGNTIGEVRVYVRTGGEFSADRWFDGLKRGRTFVTNGPMLELECNGAGPGDEVRVEKNDLVRIRARAWAPPEIGVPEKLDIVSHGRVIRTAESTDRDRRELRVDFELRAGEGQWIAARVKTRNGGLAHTSPVYLIVDGESFADRSRAGKMVAERLEVLDYIEERLRDPKFLSEFSAGEADALRARIGEARGLYRRIAESSGEQR